MSDFIGADTYCIVSYKNPKFFVDLAGGNKADGTAVQVYDTKFNNPNAQWHFVYAGVGKSGKDEYLILNVAGGTYLASPNGKIQEPIVGSAASPKEDRVRWNVIPLRNGTGAYWIAPITDKQISMSLRSGKAENRNTVKLFHGASQNTEPSSMWYLRLADCAAPVCPDVGKAPTDANSRV